MVKLYGFGAGLGLPDPSPFVVKVAHYLRMIAVAYEPCAGNARKAPKGKLPYIEDSGAVVADSSFILDHLRKKYQDLDAGMNAQDRALVLVRPGQGQSYALSVAAIHDHEELVIKPAAPKLQAGLAASR